MDPSRPGLNQPNYTLTGFAPPEENGEPVIADSDPFAAMRNAAMLSEPELTAYKTVPSEFVRTSWSESNGPSLSERSNTPLPPVGNSPKNDRVPPLLR